MMISPLITALRTLTIVPLPGKDCKRFSDSLLFFPPVGFMLGTVVYCIAEVFSRSLSGYHLAGGIVCTVMLSVLTGGLHIDGLADVADGFGGGRTREQVLAIMKDPRHGTYGVLAIVYASVARILLVAVYIEKRMVILLVVSVVVGRVVQAAGCVFLPYARKEDGTAAPFTVVRQPVRGAIVFYLVASLILCLFLKQYNLLFMLLSAYGTAAVFFMYCKNKTGGITGDCLGAASELTELFFLATGYIFLHTV